MGIKQGEIMLNMLYTTKNVCYFMCEALWASPYLVGLLWYALSCFRKCLYQDFFGQKLKTQGKKLKPMLKTQKDVKKDPGCFYILSHPFICFRRLYMKISSLTNFSLLEWTRWLWPWTDVPFRLIDSHTFFWGLLENWSLLSLLSLIVAICPLAKKIEKNV